MATAGLPTDGAKQFVDEVFPAELAAVAARRRAAEVVGGTPLEAARGAPTTQHGLVGLCLSGGGIRSAAFNLGLLQSLHRHGVLRHVDYLSTVSGGGWIGCALQSLMRAPGAPFPFTLRQPGKANESVAVSHLRDRSSSLIPKGAGGAFQVAATLLRGQFATALLLFPVTLCFALATIPLLVSYIELRTPTAPSRRWTDIPWTWFTSVSRWVVAAAGVWMILGFFYAVLERPDPARRRRLERSFGWALALALGAVFLELQPMAVAHTFRLLFSRQAAGVGPQAAQVMSVAAALASLLSLGPLSAALPRVARPLGFALASAVSFATPYLVFLVIEAWMVYGYLALGRGFLLEAAGSIAALTVALYVFQDVNVMSLHGFYRDRLTRTFLLRAADGAVEPDEEVALTSLNRDGSAAPYMLVNTAINLQGSDDRSLRGRNSDTFVFSSRFVGSPRTGFCPTAVMEHAVPGLNLGTAMAISAAAAAPNMGTYTMRSMVMLMTFLNLRLGYWLPHPALLDAWHARRGEVDLDETSAARRLAWLRWAPRVECIFRELSSRLREDTRHVYLSDGGHIENTGAYELLRRRCRVVIASDVEEDSKMHFHGLAALIRYARIDLGTEIEVDLDDLRPDAANLSRRHAAFGTIHYPAVGARPPETGILVYVKSSLTGDEDELIEEYRSRNADFPHQSTSDQLYDEAQFEAYRSLGAHAVDGLFEPGANVGAAPEGLFDWLGDLAARLTPDVSRFPAFSELRDELEEVEDLLRAPGCEAYYRELFPELAAAGAPPEARGELVAAVVARQLHVMATVFSRLALDVPERWSQPRNQGWMNLFRRWAKAPTFRRYWLVNVHQEGNAFRQFCEQALDLRLAVRWSVTDADVAAREGITVRPRPAGAAESSTWLEGRFALAEQATCVTLVARVRREASEVVVEAWGVRAGYAGTLEDRALQALQRGDFAAG